jgi:hypothetical protein
MAKVKAECARKDCSRSFLRAAAGEEGSGEVLCAVHARERDRVIPGEVKVEHPYVVVCSACAVHGLPGMPGELLVSSDRADAAAARKLHLEDHRSGKISFRPADVSAESADAFQG